MFVLGMNFDVTTNYLTQRCRWHQPSANSGARASICGNLARDNQGIVGIVEPRLSLVRGWRDDRFDEGPVGPGAHQSDVRSCTKQQLERRYEHGLAGPGLTGHDGQPWRETQTCVFDDAKPSNVEFLDHVSNPDR